MVNATIDTAAIAAIQTLIGKTLNGYTYSPVAAGAYGNVLLHIDGTAYELRCNQTPFAVGIETEDIACLSVSMHTGDLNLWPEMSSPQNPWSRSLKKSALCEIW